MKVDYMLFTDTTITKNSVSADEKGKYKLPKDAALYDDDVFFSELQKRAEAFDKALRDAPAPAEQRN